MSPHVDAAIVQAKPLIDAASPHFNSAKAAIVTGVCVLINFFQIFRLEQYLSLMTSSIITSNQISQLQTAMASK